MNGCPSSNKRHVRLMARDLRLLADLYSHRVMSRDQIISLGYFCSVPRCNDRLMRLSQAGFVRRFTSAYSTAPCQGLFGVGKSAIPLLSQESPELSSDIRGQVARTSPPLFLDHTLGIVNLRIRFETLVSQAGATVERWLPEVMCRHEYSLRKAGGRWHRQVFKPDAYLSLERNGLKRHCFLELDLGHVSLTKFAGKIHSYHLYHQLGLFGEAYGHAEFRVLVLTTGGRRLSHLKTVVGSDRRPLILFASLDDFNTSRLDDPIWQSREHKLRLFDGGAL